MNISASQRLAAPAPEEQERKFTLLEPRPQPSAVFTTPHTRGQNGLPTEEAEDSLFERFAWLYIFCREKLFRDDTERMISALWNKGSPPERTELIELGCGPGFYACEFARRFSTITVVGIDQSAQQLSCARRRAQNLGLLNCQFEKMNILEQSRTDESVDIVIASRLFTVLLDRRRALSEIHRVLRRGGRCLIAEPRHALRASIPLLAMWFLAGMTRCKNGYREPRKASVLAQDDFAALFSRDPWKKCEVWLDGRYQYALCEKG